MQMRHAYLAILLLGFASSGLLGCEDDAEDVVNALSCSDVCDRYQECVDEDFDTAACTSDCEENVDQYENQEERLEDCDSCLEERSCSEGTFECADECVGVIDVTQ